VSSANEVPPPDPAPAPDPLRPVATCDRSIVGGYRLAAASVIGRGHVLQQRPCDDAFSLVAGGDGSREWWFAAVADGAGSRPLSRFGAEAATWAAAERAIEALGGGAAVRDAVAAAAAHARVVQAEHASQRGFAVSDLSCTLLCLACVREGSRLVIATFQVGDGLIATVDDRGVIAPLAQSDDQVPGQTLFLDSLGDDALAARIRSEELAGCPRGFLIATDGLADDLIPWSENGPILAGELEQMAALDGDAGAKLGDILSYEKRGSFDDRTLVVGWRRSESP
jgi:hypothetical protein